LAQTEHWCHKNRLFKISQRALTNLIGVKEQFHAGNT